jgi:hypothetical protein
MDRHRLIELPPGSVFYATILKPDSKGMIDGICGGNAVLMFSSDLKTVRNPPLLDIPTRYVAPWACNSTWRQTVGGSVNEGGECLRFLYLAAVKLAEFGA